MTTGSEGGLTSSAPKGGECIDVFSARAKERLIQERDKNKTRGTIELKENERETRNEEEERRKEILIGKWTENR